jgi:GNAT superfamily N-acetyltransferase
VTTEKRHGTSAPIAVRKLRQDDRADWEALWHAYQVFYEVSLSRKVTDSTWMRLLDGSVDLHGICATSHDAVVGICHYLFHASTWATTSYCYLEDLYTLPDYRGQGVGSALIRATADHARANGSDKLYWQTHITNTVGQSLYNKVARHAGFIVYELKP